MISATELLFSIEIELAVKTPNLIAQMFAMEVTSSIIRFLLSVAFNLSWTAPEFAMELLFKMLIVLFLNVVCGHNLIAQTYVLDLLFWIERLLAAQLINLIVITYALDHQQWIQMEVAVNIPN